jgi:hypothetical protein
MNRLTTDLTVSLNGYEKTFPVVVEYWHQKAFNGGRSEPSYPEHVEIGSVYALVNGEKHPLLSQYAIEAMIPDLEALCLEDWREADGYARESAAEMRRLDVHKLAAAE